MVKISPDLSPPREIPNCDSPHMNGSPHCPYEKADPPFALKNESPHLHGGQRIPCYLFLPADIAWNTVVMCELVLGMLLEYDILSREMVIQWC